MVRYNLQTEVDGRNILSRLERCSISLGYNFNVTDLNQTFTRQETALNILFLSPILGSRKRLFQGIPIRQLDPKYKSISIVNYDKDKTLWTAETIIVTEQRYGSIDFELYSGKGEAYVSLIPAKFGFEVVKARPLDTKKAEHVTPSLDCLMAKFNEVPQ